MKKEFPGHYRPTPQDFESLWKNAIIALDASLLLDLYRYSDETRKEFLRVLRSLDTRLWLPYRAAHEFFKNRLSVISQQQKAYDDGIKSIEQLEQTFKNKRHHPFISEILLEELMSVHGKIKKEL
ncbi:MAG: PIN-like domain-containing protein, partial [Chthoniobacterales bacterium]